MTIAPGVDEDAVAERETEMGLISNTAEMVHILAKAKAEAEALEAARQQQAAQPQQSPIQLPVPAQ